jgi:CheY-like chemotaxis protein
MAEHENAVDVVLTDVVMPGMSGIDLARRLRSDRPAIPIVYFSGHGDEVDRPDGGPLIRKPFTPEELVKAIAEVLPARLLASP